jgi:hypothetical protein
MCSLTVFYSAQLKLKVDIQLWILLQNSKFIGENKIHIHVLQTNLYDRKATLQTRAIVPIRVRIFITQ